MVRCSVEGCDVPKIARGLCPNHYAAKKYHGALPPRIREPWPEPPPITLDERELGYLSAMLDAEGSICVMKIRTPTRRRPAPTYNLRVDVTNTHEPTVQRYRELFGGVARRLVRGTNRPIFCWCVSQLLALRCITTLLPALRIKRRQADVAVRFMATFRRENQGRNLIGSDVLSERLRLVEELSALNNSHWRRKRQRKQQPTGQNENKRS